MILLLLVKEIKNGQRGEERWKLTWLLESACNSFVNKDLVEWLDGRQKPGCEQQGSIFSVEAVNDGLQAL